ncbi:MAG: transglutaminase family protein [Gammaproteobacteria bacterium]|nr:transglutaminase family protein [Gammaproteobacteria bacterium]
MSRLVNEYKKDLTIRELALDLIRGVPGKNWRAEANRIFQFVRDQIRYVRDIQGVETIATPVKTLEYGQGDCDDQVVLLAALLESVSHPTAFVAIGYGPQQYSHVYLQTRVDRHWIGMDPTEPWPMGMRPKMPYQMVHYNR